MTLGSQIRQLRADRGLTLRQFAGQIGYSVTYLCDVERERARPSGKFLAAVADACGLEVDLLCRRAYRHPEPNAALRQFTQEANLSLEEFMVLADLAYRGKQPQTVAGWRFLWDAIRLVCGGLEEDE